MQPRIARFVGTLMKKDTASKKSRSHYHPDSKDTKVAKSAELQLL